MNPKISIITVVKNDENGLERTLKSILTQNFTEWECIIIVGESSDSTLSIAYQFTKVNSNFRVFKQNGTGIYQAMNEGIEESDSELLWFMNADDIFISSNSLGDSYDLFMKKNCDLLIAGYKVKGKNRNFINISGWKKPIQLAFSRRGICHQTMIFRKDLFNQLGSYDSRYVLCADYKIVLLSAKKYKVYRASYIVCEMAPNGISDRNLKKMHLEKQNIRDEVFNNSLISVFGKFWMSIILCKKKINPSR